MIPIFVTIQGGLSFEASKKILRGHMSGEEAGSACKEDGDSVALSEPFNGTSVSLSRRGLASSSRRPGLGLVPVLAVGLALVPFPAVSVSW